jgi:hypothetical protein
VPSALALGTYELSEGGIFLKYPVVFLKHLTVQVQKLMPVSNIQEAKSFEPSAAPPLKYEISHQCSASHCGR